MPFAASVVIVLGSPKAELAQSRALIGGHLVSTFIGLLIVKLLGPGPWTAALAVGLAMVAMHLTGRFIRRPGSIRWWWLSSVLGLPGRAIGIGAVLLALFAYAWHKLVARGANRRDTWPARWW